MPGKADPNRTGENVIGVNQFGRGPLKQITWAKVGLTSQKKGAVIRPALYKIAPRRASEQEPERWGPVARGREDSQDVPIEHGTACNFPARFQDKIQAAFPGG